MHLLTTLRFAAVLSLTLLLSACYMTESPVLSASDSLPAEMLGTWEFTPGSAKMQRRFGLLRYELKREGNGYLMVLEESDNPMAARFRSLEPGFWVAEAISPKEKGSQVFLLRRSAQGLDVIAPEEKVLPVLAAKHGVELVQRNTVLKGDSEKILALFRDAANGPLELLARGTKK